MSEIRVYKFAGSFAENKDAAAKIRDELLIPSLDRGDEVTLDFDAVDFATQSFVHAMLVKAVRENEVWLDRILFTNCSEAVQGIIEIVVDYAQEVD
ncbi:STAS-like domain-containing protein [Nocardia harenae]|uniref:STAS-like domain-containing protein n=1 Tax=Nocardia harenae TaxID=358707 RepID=UPI0009FEA14B|nr:STAS-like domain-containing protein [Nocardia harenae]